VDTASVKVANLSKAYTPFYRAVNEVYFSLDYGECFALLGVTGAGKTSTFKCLTGEEIPDEGDMMMGGFNLRQRFGFASARSKVGYCPQFEAIYDGLTVREHLELYAIIKGVRADYQNELVIR
jgi:ATP-binding cassette, subfamily A (ABC1), member 3